MDDDGFDYTPGEPVKDQGPSTFWWIVEIESTGTRDSVEALMMRDLDHSFRGRLKVYRIGYLDTPLVPDEQSAPEEVVFDPVLAEREKPYSVPVDVPTTTMTGVEVHDPPEYEAEAIHPADQRYYERTPRSILSVEAVAERCDMWPTDQIVLELCESHEALRSRLADTEGRFRAERGMADLIGLGSRANLERAEAAEGRLADTEAERDAARAELRAFHKLHIDDDDRVAALTEALRATTGWLDEWWADPDNPPAAPRQWRTLLSEDGSG